MANNALPEPVPVQPGLYLVGTPIGNLEDLTFRALRILTAADVLACEDTRVTRKLFQRYGLAAPKTILAANDHNERTVALRLIDYILAGRVVAFCSDAGMPAIADPGFNILKAAREAGVHAEVIPGPSAVATAVAFAGVAATPFTFFGFPPRRDGRLRAILDTHGRLAPALVFYESPRRLARLLAMAADVMGRDRQAAVCLELTKKFERVGRGALGDLAAHFTDRETKGEAVVIIEGAASADTHAGPDDK